MSRRENYVLSGAEIKKLLTDFAMTAKDLANEIGITPRHMGNIINHKAGGQLSGRAIVTVYFTLSASKLLPTDDLYHAIYSMARHNGR